MEVSVVYGEKGGMRKGNGQNMKQIVQNWSLGLREFRFREVRSDSWN